MNVYPFDYRLHLGILWVNFLHKLKLEVEAAESYGMRQSSSLPRSFIFLPALCETRRCRWNRGQCFSQRATAS